MIELAEAATRAYYENLSAPETDSQCYRNYAAYFRSLPSEESALYEDMCIMPEKCSARTIGLNKDGSYPKFGSYCIMANS